MGISTQDAMKDPPLYYIGRRVCFHSFLGTIRWIGYVENTGREWLGVEWDNETRGRHNGMTGGKRYFHCQSSQPNCASFVNVRNLPDPEVSFVEAVAEKYAGGTLEEVSASGERAVKISGKLVQNVGFGKIHEEQSQLNALKYVLVDGARIKTAETKERSVKDTCPDIFELDLSRNLFDDFEEIIKICSSLQKLRALRLNGNRLNFSQHALTAIPNTKLAFGAVTHLELNDTKLPWESLAKLAHFFEELKTLTACQNNFDLITIPLLASNITQLKLDENAFRSLSDLSLLVHLPVLQNLHLKGNLISAIGPTPPVFSRRLKCLDLSYNQIYDWAFVDQLSDAFPGMMALRMSGNPLYDIPIHDTNSTSTADDVFMLIVARIGKLVNLNYSPITDLERTNAELFYLSLIGRDMMKVPPEEEDKVIVLHKHYAELSSKHDFTVGVRRPADAIDPDLLEARLIRFKFYLPANSVPGQTNPILKVQQIPKEFDVYRVKGVVGKRFHLQPSRFRLILMTGEFDFDPKYKDQDQRSEETTSGESNSDKAQSFRTDISSETELSPLLKGKGYMKEREVDIVEGTRPIGNVVDGMEAKVRLELIHFKSTTHLEEILDSPGDSSIRKREAASKAIARGAHRLSRGFLESIG